MSTCCASTCSPNKDINLVYVWKKKKMYDDAIKKLNKAARVFILPISFPNVNVPGKDILSMVYMCTTSDMFIFDMLMMKTAQLPKELMELINSQTLKVVYSAERAFLRLGIENWMTIPNIFDPESLGLMMPGGLQTHMRAINDIYGDVFANQPPYMGPRISDMNWTSRPFKNNEHFAAAKRLLKLMKLIRFADPED